MSSATGGPTTSAPARPRAGGEPRGREEGAAEVLLPIGQVAERLGVSERALRYYEEIGLLDPVERTPGRVRRYSESDIARVVRIKELRELMGFNLDEVGAVLTNEDRLQDLRREYRSGRAAPARRAQLLAESLELQEDLRAKVVAKIDHLAEFLAELDARLERIRAAAGLTPRDEEAVPAASGPQAPAAGTTSRA